MRTIFRRFEYKSDLASVARRGDPINAPATPTPKSFMLAREIDRLNAEAAQIESRADQNARGGSARSSKKRTTFTLAPGRGRRARFRCEDLDLARQLAVSDRPVSVRCRLTASFRYWPSA